MRSRAQDDALLGERFVGCVRWMHRVPGGGSSGSGELGVPGCGAPYANPSGRRPAHSVGSDMDGFCSC